MRTRLPAKALSQLARRCADARERLSCLRLRSIVVASLTLATALVAAHLPLRWHGARSDQSADVPLRPLTPAETAALLAGASDAARLAGLVQFTKAGVVVRTRVYPVISDTPIGECARQVAFRGALYHICSSTWEGYHNMHIVNRAELERELRRPLSERDLTPEYLSDSIVSFSSARLPAYFATEVVFLTVLWTSLVSVLRRIRNPLLVPPLVAIGGVAATLFVPFYSPAFFDADWFYQRIAVEEFIGGRGPLGVSFSAVMAFATPLSMFCVPLYALHLFVEGVRRLSGQTATRVRVAVAGALFAALCIQLAIEYQRYAAERSQAAEALHRVEVALAPAALSVLKTDAAAKPGVEFFRSGILSTPAAAAADSIVSAAAPMEEGRIFIPMNEGWHVFLWANSRFKYGDVRQLKGAYSQQADYEILEPLLRKGQPYETSFWGYLASTYLVARAFRDSQHRITAVAVVGSDIRPTDPRTFRGWWQLLFGRPLFQGSSEVRSLRGVRR